jgi:hypothetical protein
MRHTIRAVVIVTMAAIVPAAALATGATESCDGRRGSTCGNRSSGGGGSGNDKAVKALQLGIQVLQGLSNGNDDDDAEEERKARARRKADQDKWDRQKADAERNAEQLKSNAKGATIANPWANKPSHKLSIDGPANVDPVALDAKDGSGRKGEKPVELPKMESKAPYGDSSCATFKPSKNRGKIDWDALKVGNKCSYPIQVLSCYYDVGDEKRCAPASGLGSWGLSGTIRPGTEQSDVATSRKWPWKVTAFVCNMTPRKHNYMNCVLPDKYRR